MCKDKSSTLASTPRSRLRPPSVPTSANLTSRTTGTATTASSNLKPSTSSSTSSSRISQASLQGSLPDRPILYQINEIRRATNNFVSGRLSSSSSASSWRCNLRGKDVVIVQREFSGDPAGVGERLSSVCRSNHIGLLKLLGVCVNGGDSIFLVYEHVKGASLADCLRNKQNPNFSPISSWLSRMQVADDVAQGLEYIHKYSSSSHHGQPVHNLITSGNILVTEGDLRGKICHFGTSELTGEMDGGKEGSRSGSKQGKRTTNGEIEEEETNKDRRSRNRRMKIKGTRGYMAPEVVAGASPSQKTDVFAFGVVLLEILTGEEPIHCRNKMDRPESVSLIDTARDVMGSDEGEWEDEEKRRRLRRWADRRLKDSFPVDVAEKVLEVALECVQSDAVRRPDMVVVAGKLSQCLITSLQWADNMKVPLDFSITNAPR